MKNKRIDFVCIGAFHQDYIMQLKGNYYKNRSNPIIEYKTLGGVAFRIAERLSFLNVKNILFSLNCKSEDKIKILRKKIIFKPLTKKIYDRSYNAILNQKGEMILGLANMDNYEKNLHIPIINNFINKQIIVDLNLSHRNIKSLINNNYLKNNIHIIGTSAHKVYKINDCIKKINTLILNKQESLTLTKTKTIFDALKKLIKTNKDITIIITNGKNTIYSYNKKVIYLCKPLKINVKNENGAGDIMSALLIYYLYKKNNFKNALAKSIVAGSLQASNYKLNKKTYLQKIQQMSKRVKVKLSKYNG